MNEPRAIFRSVSQALHVSYLMATLPVTSKCSTQTLIEMLREQAGQPRERAEQREGGVNFSGMTPLEVRGECAKTIGAVNHHCTPIERAAIEGWFIQAEPDKRGHRAMFAAKTEAMWALREHCASAFTIEGESPRLLILWQIHSQGRARDICTERAIAGQYCLSQPTVHRNIVAVGKVCAALRRRGMDRLQALWERDGKIEREPVRVSS